MSAWNTIKRDFTERFLKWETVTGLIYIPWGYGFIWYGVPSKEVLLQYSIWHERFGYNYALVSVGVVLIVIGLRKVQVNRIKQAVIRERLMKKHKQAIGLPQ